MLLSAVSSSPTLISSAHSTSSITTGATSVMWNGQSGQAMPGQYIVTSSLTATQLANSMRAAGLNPTAVSSLATGIFGTDKYLVVDKTTPVAAVNWWGQHALGVVTAIGPNYVYHASLLPSEIANPIGTNPWGTVWQYNNNGTLTSTDINNQVHPAVAGADVNMYNAWDLGTGDFNNVVAVLDTGVADINTARADGTTHPAHPDLVQSAWLNKGDFTQDGVDEDGNGVIDDINGADFTTIDPTTGAIAPDNDVTDIFGHGTFVAGLIAGNANNQFGITVGNPPITYQAEDMAGINWKVQIMPVKVLDDTGAGTSASIIAGLNYVLYMKRIEHVNIIGANLSLGGHFEGPINGIGDPTGVSQENVALQQLNDAGVIITIAAGNEGLNNDVFPVSPANFKSNLTLTVASTNESDQLSSFSNFGSRVQLAAPGEDIFSTISLDATAFLDIIGPQLGPPHQTVAFDSDGYSFASGTSFAAPMVMGAVALLKSIVPSASPQQIVNAILQGVDVLPQLAGKVTSGGRLDIFRSAEILLGNQPVIGSVDSITAKKVQGWVFDPNMGAKPDTGFVLVDGATAIPFTTNVQRPDVDNVVYNDFWRKQMGTTRGFSVDLGDIGPGKHTIQVFFNDVSQINGVITLPNGNFIQNARLMTTKVIEGNLLPIGNVDIANAALIAGWAWDPNVNGPINVRIDIDGQTAAIVTASNFHSVQVGNQGFAYKPNVSQGFHRVDVYALDDFTGQPVLIGTRTIFGDASLQYTDIKYDAVTRTVTGYVVDPDSAFDPVSMQVTIDGPSGQRQYLQDVANIDDPTKVGFISVPGNTKHKFSIQLPNVTPGNHLVNLYAFDNETGQRVELLSGKVPTLGNTLPTGNFNQVTAGTITATVRDADSPANTNLKYRIDVTDTVGTSIVVGQLATSNGNAVAGGGPNVTVSPDYTYSPGTYLADLRVADAQSAQLVDLTPFPAGRAFVVPAIGQPVGALNNPVTSGQAVAGTVTDVASTAQTFVVVTLFVNGVASGVSQNVNIGAAPGPFTFTPAQVKTAVGGANGAYHLEVRAADVDGVTPDTLLGAGEYVIGPNPQAAGQITIPGAGTSSGNAKGFENDVKPQLVLGVNNVSFTQFTITPNGANLVNFTANTPALRDVGNNLETLWYVDPVTGQRVQLGPSVPIPTIPINNFINQRLVVTGNQMPQGNLDAASVNGIAGWVRDGDLPGTSIMYRLDIDGSLGAPQTASIVRNDLPFLANDRAHGFSIIPPLLTAGSHTVKLYAIDPTTLDVVLVGQRTFTVLDDSNRRPIGAVDVLNSAGAQGWVQDPTTPNAAVTLELRVDGAVVATTTSGPARTDLPQRNGAFVQAYNLAMPGSVAAGIHYVEVYAIDTSDATRKVQLKAGVVEVGTHQIGGTFDLIDFTTIAGWAQGGANDANPQFRLVLNGVTIQTFTAPQTTENGINIRRFSFPTPPVANSFNNTFQVYYVDPNTDQSILVATRVLAPSLATIGRVDVANSTQIAGWAFSPTLPNAQVVVQILLDGTEIGSTTAGLDRGDLTGQLAGHAFQFNTPTLPSGKHIVSVRFRDPVTGDYSLVAQSAFLQS